MVTKSFFIRFEYRLDQAMIAIQLSAEVQVHDNPAYYLVRNISALNDVNSAAIPELRLTKKTSAWVHLDSQKPTDLTMCIGEAIDAVTRD